MSALEPAAEKIVRNLREATERLQEDVERVELWTGVLNSFTRPIPNYEPGDSKFVLPPANPRPKSAARDID